MSARELGVLVVLGGLAVTAVGALIAIGGFAWFGRLPGDVQLDGWGGRVRVFAPIVSMLVVSVVLTLLINVFRRWLS